MKKNRNDKKIRLVLSLVICVLFIATAFSGAQEPPLEETEELGEEAEEINASEPPLEETEELGEEAEEINASEPPLEETVTETEGLEGETEEEPLDEPYKDDRGPSDDDWDYWSNTPHMFSNVTGNVGIGTTNPGAKLDVRGSAVFNENGGNHDFRIESDTLSSIFKIDADRDEIQIGVPHEGLSVDVIFTLANNGNAPFEVIACSNTPVYRGLMNFYRSRGTVASPSAVQDGDFLGDLKMKAYDGSSWKPACQILAQVDGTPVSGSYTPGKLVFRTTGGAGGLQERMVILGNGNIGIGTSSPDGKLDVENSGIYLSEIVAPGMPNAGKGVIYAKSDSKLYFKNDGGIEYDLTSAGGGGIGGSGTTNYIPKFTGSTTIGNSVIYETGGDVGIGTTSPGTDLDVYGTQIISPTSDGIVNIGSTSGFHVTLDNNEIHARYGGSTSDLFINDFGGDVYIGRTSDVDLSNILYTDKSTGGVGIGTSSPAEKLHVAGDIRLDAGGDIAFADDNTRIRESSDDLYFEADDDIYISPDDDIRMDGSTLFVDGSANRVGIGTTAPAEKLHVVGDIRLDAGGDIAFADDNTRIRESVDDLYFEADDDIYISPDDDIRMDGDTLFVDGSANRVGIGATSLASNKLYVYRPSTDYGAGHTTIYGYRAGTSGSTNGGTSWSISGVDAAVKGNSFWGNQYTAGVAGYNYNDYDYSTAVIGSDSDGSLQGFLAYKSDVSEYGVYGRAYDGTETNYGVYAYGGSTSSNNAVGVYSKVYRDGSGSYWSGWFGDDNSGGTYNGLYADYRTGDPIDIAEYIKDTNDNTLPGDVVIADPDNDESVIKSSKPYDTSVLGVISTDPAMTLGMRLIRDEETGERYEDVHATQLALTGRVPVKVTDENGPIQPGDLLTTSSKPGYAMKWTLLEYDPDDTDEERAYKMNENERRDHAVLGKALGSLASGEGTITVLVTLQ